MIRIALVFAMASLPSVALAEAPWTCPAVTPAQVSPSDAAWKSKPFVDGNIRFVGGKIAPWAGESISVTSPIVDETTGERAIIGSLSKMGGDGAVEAVEAASAAWDMGQGEWPQMSLAERIARIEAVVTDLQEVREEIIQVLMWEICKNTGDAAKEFDRTMEYVSASISAAKESNTQGFLGDWTTVSGVRARQRRGPVGVNLLLAPFNYPLNEMYAMLVPALLMGNTVVMKLPAIGGLAHILTAKAYAKHLPAGVLNFVSGSGRVTCTPMMETGKIDMLGFIGGSNAADALISAHPHAHRLKVFSQLEGKNLGIVLPDADLDTAADQCVLGATSYNGQRCTAIKLMAVHESVADEFVKKVLEKVEKLKVGLPWEEGVKITPLPEPKKPAYLEELIADAVGQGATVVNAEQGGGSLAGALFSPAVVYPVHKDMRLFNEEQFGPVLPITTFNDIEEIHAAIKRSWNGQQAALFTSDATGDIAAPLVDRLSTVVGRININVQCGRSPDVFPFSGRRSSAMGTMSVSEALRGFSVETVVAYAANNEISAAVAAGVDSKSSFLAPL